MGKSEPITVEYQSGLRAEQAWANGAKTISWSGGILNTATIARIEHDKQIIRIEAPKEQKLTEEQELRAEAIRAFIHKCLYTGKYELLKDKKARDNFIENYISV